MAEATEISSSDELPQNKLAKEIDCATPFLQNLSENFMNESFSDVTLQIGNDIYPAHKSFLAASSSYFERMFYGEWKERKEQKVKLEETPDCQEVFPDFLRYFYTGRVSVNCQSVVPLVTLADKYDVVVMKDHCLQYMFSVINNADIEYALSWLTFAEQMSDTSLEQRCYDIICFNYEKSVLLPTWPYLSYAQLLTILQRSDLVVPTEYCVYLGVHNWLKANETATDELDEILSHIHFKKMTTDELLQVEQSDLASNSSIDKQIIACVLQAFRYFAVSKNSDVKSSIPERIYVSDMGFLTAKVSGGFAQLYPNRRKDDQTMQMSVSPGRQHTFERYQYRLEQTGEVKITVSLPASSRRHAHAYYIEQCTVHVKALVLFRSSNGNIYCILSHSKEAQLPIENGGTLITLPRIQTATPTLPDSLEASGVVDDSEVLYSLQISIVQK